ncbi:DciA family protein [Kangiella sp. M94]
MKRPFRAKSVADVLNSPESELKSLLDKANSLKSITDSIHQHLPKDLQKHCSVSEYNKTSLVITADSPVWATRLRYQSSELLAQLRKAGFLGLANIQIKIAPSK